MRRVLLAVLLVASSSAAWLGSTAPAAAQQQGCHPSYPSICIPLDVSDADCEGGTGDGPYYVRETNIRVLEPDPHDLDQGGVPGLGCEPDERASGTSGAGRATTTPTLATPQVVPAPSAATVPLRDATGTPVTSPALTPSPAVTTLVTAPRTLTTPATPAITRPFAAPTSNSGLSTAGGTTPARTGAYTPHQLALGLLVLVTGLWFVVSLPKPGRHARRG